MKDLFIATNNGDIGGGEVMLLNIARAARSVGQKVTIIGPAQPAELVEAAQDEGFPTVVLPAHSRLAYLAQLQFWVRRNLKGQVLWCNGLVPAFATSLTRNRIVHLHQIPKGKQKYLAAIAKQGALAVLAPSDFAVSKIRGSQRFYNWVQAPEPSQHRSFDKKVIRIGFLGRPSDFKGTQHLAQALLLLNQKETKTSYELVIGGESRFVSERDKIEMSPALASLGKKLIELGWTSPAQYFSQIDIAVVPSNWDEVFGLVAAETMSAGVPLIVSDAGALPEIVGKDYPYIFPRADVQELADMIKTVAEDLKTKSPLLEETVRQATWRWLEAFSPQAGQARVSEILKNIEQQQV